MSKTVDVTGQRFERLTVIGRSSLQSSAGALWECRCDCGNITVTTSLKLRKGLIKSCGCYKLEHILGQRETHGYSKDSRTYRSWKEMRQRCLNSNSDKWKWYGGRGISIDSSWDSFEIFLQDMGFRPVGKTLDRKDSDGNYCKDNCRWATPVEQAETNRGCFQSERLLRRSTPL